MKRRCSSIGLEQLICNQVVVGSIPSIGSFFIRGDIQVVKEGRL